MEEHGCIWAFGLGEAGMSDCEAIYLVEITNTKWLLFLGLCITSPGIWVVCFGVGAFAEYANMPA